jgi:hypothetical protein
MCELLRWKCKQINIIGQEYKNVVVNVLTGVIIFDETTSSYEILTSYFRIMKLVSPATIAQFL